MGSKQGSRHSVPDLRKDINTLMNALQEHNVYTYQKGRVAHQNDGPVPDVLSAGLTALTTAATSGESPLSEFNTQFNRIRERRKLVPVSAKSPVTPIPLPSNTSPVIPIPETSANDSVNTDMDDSVLTLSDDLVSCPVIDENEVEMVDESDSGETDHGADIDNFEADSPTLTRLDEDDVALEMDEWELDDGSEEEGEDEGDNEIPNEEE